MEKQLPVALPTNEIAEFCHRHHIRGLALFGSVLRTDFRPESDIDVLVEFEPDHTLVWPFLACRRNWPRFWVIRWI